jgi:uncharacterized membrane protein YkvA (DUF1232 family)
MFIQLIIAIIIALVSYLLAPKPPRPTDAVPQTPDGIPTIDDTAVVGVLFGTRVLKQNNVVWYGDLKTTPIKLSSGGK